MSDIDTFLDDWAAAELAGDTAALESLLTDDFLGVGPLGFTLPKGAWLDRHAPDGGLSYETYGLDEVQTRVHGNAAVVTARQNARGDYRGTPTPDPIRATLSLVNDAGRWQLVGIHMSFIAGDAPKEGSDGR